MIVTAASNTQTCSIGTEHFLSSTNAGGVYFPYLDLNALAAGDVLEARIYGMGIGGGTSRLLALMVYNGVQPANKLVVNPLLDSPNYGAPGYTNSIAGAGGAFALRFSITQTFGTGRDIPWRLDRQLDLERALTEPAAIYAWAAGTVEDLLNLMGAFLTNTLTETATTQTLRNRADAATIGTATVSDDGTTGTRGSFS